MIGHGPSVAPPRQGRVGPLTAALAVSLALLAAAPLAAQEVAGVALGPDGNPLAGVAVVLHGVGAGGGAMAGVDTTGAAGEFRFQLPAQDSSVYFAALRYEGSLYVGPAIQAGGDPVTGYVLQVSPSSEAGAVGAAMGNPMTPPPATARPGPGSRSSTDAGAIWLVAILALSAAGVFVFTAPRYRARRTREAVMEVARIENRLAGSAADLSDAERQRLEEQRDRLKEQLAPRD